MFFDFIFIFTVYPCILTIKLELMRTRELNFKEEDLSNPANYKKISISALSDKSNSATTVSHVKILVIIGVMLLQLRGFNTSSNDDLTFNSMNMNNDNQYIINILKIIRTRLPKYKNVQFY